VSTSDTLLIFVGIPLAVVVVIYVAVSAAGWMKPNRIDDVEADGPIFVTSAAPVPDPARVPDEIGVKTTSFAGGGAHGNW